MYTAGIQYQLTPPPCLTAAACATLWKARRSKQKSGLSNRLTKSKSKLTEMGTEDLPKATVDTANQRWICWTLELRGPGSGSSPLLPFCAGSEARAAVRRRCELNFRSLERPFDKNQHSRILTDTLRPRRAGWERSSPYDRHRQCFGSGNCE